MSDQSTAEGVLDSETIVDTSEDTGDTSEDTSEEGSGAATKGLSWEQAMKRVPKDVAVLMKSMQADYTRKTQAAAESKRELMKERAAFLAAPKLDDSELPEYDPYNESTVAARIEREVAKRLQEALAPMRQEYEAAAAEDAYLSFQEAHPEFQTDLGLRSEVQNLLETNGSLDLETAYWAAKGKQAKIISAKEKAKQTVRRQATREAALTGTGTPRRGSGTATGKPDVKSMSMEDILKLAKSMNS